MTRGVVLGQMARVHAGRGDARGTLDCLQDAINHAAQCGDRATLFGTLEFAVATLVEIGRPTLALVAACAAASGHWTIFGGEARAALERAIAQARCELGPEQADALWARVEALSYEDMVEHLRAELSQAIASN
jgi:hypothetical protein